MNSRFTSLSAVLLLVLFHACSEEPGATDARSAPPTSRGERAFAPFQAELLDLAWRAATAFPLDPHVKTRSRVQQQVIDLWLELGQVDRARLAADEVANWRRGACYADIARHRIGRGESTEVDDLLGRARAIADQHMQGADAQQWRRDAILARIAEARLAQGDLDGAGAMRTGLEDSEVGRLDAAFADRLAAGDFDAQVERIDAVLAQGGLEQVRNALLVAARLFDRFYDDEARRGPMRERVQHGFAKLPLQLRIELLAELAKTAVDHGDRRTALGIVGDAQLLFEGGRWLAENRVPMMGRLAGLRHLAGDGTGAGRELKAALGLFDAEREQIIDIYRAAALRPIAEAYVAIGDLEAARAVYLRALDEGQVNPNSRPRAEDLVATCCSMVEHGFEPDTGLLGRLNQVLEGLGDPW
jgi:tetratricopeptide (TPR) repeat protein